MRGRRKVGRSGGAAKSNSLQETEGHVHSYTILCFARYASAIYPTQQNPHPQQPKRRQSHRRRTETPHLSRTRHTPEHGDLHECHEHSAVCRRNAVQNAQLLWHWKGFSDRRAGKLNLGDDASFHSKARPQARAGGQGRLPPGQSSVLVLRFYRVIQIPCFAVGARYRACTKRSLRCLAWRFHLSFEPRPAQRQRSYGRQNAEYLPEHFLLVPNRRGGSGAPYGQLCPFAFLACLAVVFARSINVCTHERFVVLYTGISWSFPLLGFLFLGSSQQTTAQS